MAYAQGTPGYVPVHKIIDSSDKGYTYGYGPAIIYDGQSFYMFYCSQGTVGWDDIRFATSTDGRRWSSPKSVLTATSLTTDTATCDPSVVYYDARDGGGSQYYLFYSGFVDTVGTVMFVARSPRIGGPYAKWTARNTWEVNAPDPKRIMSPVKAVPKNQGYYGAGQQTVVVKDGKLYSWHSDDTLTYAGVPASPTSKRALMFTSTTSPTAWPTPREVLSTTSSSDDVSSVDVKFDASTGRFILFNLVRDHSPTVAVVRRTSVDGVTWSAPETLCSATCMVDYSHNIGVSGSNVGHLISNRTLMVFGAPYDNNRLGLYKDIDCENTQAEKPYCITYWDLYAAALNPLGSVWNAVPWEWQWEEWKDGSRLALGDYDGDKRTDTAIVTASGQWYVVGSATPERNGVARIPWGWQWNGMTDKHHIALGDYDGDGKTDRAIVNPSTAQWYILSSATGEKGVPGIPWGWQWPGMTSSYRLALGDYDGDRKTDRAIINPATGQWYVIASSGASVIPWGWQWPGMTSNHQLALGDYDGDRKTDRAIVNPATGQWYVIASSGASVVPWGWTWEGMTSSHRLALGDYDGDTKTDRSIVNPATGQWYILASTTGGQGVPGIPWEWTWDGMNSVHQLALGDYDGDGKTDRAIIHPNDKRWYVLGSRPFQIYR